MSFKNILILILSIFLITGCSTTEKFSVYDTAGAKIFTPYNTVTPQGIASHSSEVKMVVPSDMYCGYILIQPTDSKVKIPIGLDYKVNRHTGTKAALGTGYALASAGLGTMFGGLIAMIGAAANDDDDATSVTGLVVGAGAAVAGIGTAIGGPAHSRLRQTAFDYNFGYEKQQRIEMPQLSFTLLNPNKPKGDAEQLQDGSKTTLRRRASSGEKVKPTSDITSSASSSHVNKNRLNHSKKIEGTYSGSGSLLRNGNVEERYTDISVIVKRLDRNHVSVTILESGEEYFDAPLEYEVISAKDGFNLIMDKLPEATIHISKNGKLHFIHKKVNVENIFYTLDLTTQKE